MFCDIKEFSLAVWDYVVQVTKLLINIFLHTNSKQNISHSCNKSVAGFLPKNQFFLRWANPGLF